MNEVYKIGVLTNPEPNDTEVYERHEANSLAQELAAKDPNSPIAIWDQGDEVVALFINGDEFEPI